MNNIKILSLKNIITTDNIEYIKNNYIKLLSYLSIVNDISSNEFKNYIDDIYKNGIIYVITINDIDIIGTGTIFLEQKIIRNCKKVGHIEDVIVHPDYRNKGYSSLIVNKLKDYGFENNCYKIILDCDENIKKVYEKCGFKNKSIQMSNYLQI
jgi:glucosamine-phosphate N-acetyltransferase